MRTLPRINLVLLALLFALSSIHYAASDAVYDKFVQCLSSHSNTSDQISSIVFSPENPSYKSVLLNYIRNLRFTTAKTPKPAIIVTPTSEAHVQAAVICAKSNNLLMKVRSGGHDYEGISYISNGTFIILDMFNLRAIDISIADESAIVQAGATLGELYYSIWEKSKVHGFPAGVCPTVGVGGHVSGGGYGNMLRKYGLTVDHVYDAKIVDVNGRILDRLLLQPVDSDTKGRKTLRVSFIGNFLGDADRLINVMSEGLPELGLKKEDCMEMSWIQSMLVWANFDKGTPPSAFLNRTYDSNFLKRKSDYVKKPISKVALDSIWKKMIALGKTGLVFNAYGGRMSEILEDETPFPHRAGNLYKIQYSVNWEDGGVDAESKYLDQIRQLYSFMTPFVSNNPRESYLNYRDLDIGVSDNGRNGYNEALVYGRKYFKGNFDRLVAVKSAVDPDNFFRNEQSIPVQPSKGNK
ncbi:hypothetical protein RJ639_041892 [Escallonia herrerae]|uniref:FAD-binding PCMH-type domain-containing protein n=1 Tax=Escallonia herrerae TaxID=1293975 RepID=A0AA89B3W6_9ASTE|nr:hypothetical protein RJ639_041892 [Escallonia herrerae]